MRRVLLTGGLGYIGSHTAIALAEAGFEVVLYDNLSNGRPSVLDRLESITGVRFPFIEGDVRDTMELVRVLELKRIEAVIHLAGFKAVGESVEQPLAYYDNNIAGILSLANAMQSVGVERLVFSSSATVYGNPQYLPIDELHPTVATSPYGRTKLQGEEILADLARANPNWRIVCLRYFNPIGAHDSGLIGEDPAGIPNNLMPYVAKVAAGLLPFLNVYGDDYGTPDGTGVRDYIHVMDLAEGHSSALDFLCGTTGWHAINLGAGKGVSVLELVRAFEKTSGQRVPCRVIARRAGDVAVCYATAQKAREVLKWRACRSLEDMCKSTWRFQLSQQSSELL